MFQVFQVFRVFHLAFGPQKSPVLVQIRTKPEKSVPSHLRHIMGAENTQKSNSPIGLRTRSYPSSYRRSFFSAKRLFFRAARDVSGVRSNPPWARVEIKLKMSFQALSHSSSHERASALTSPPPDFLFSSIPPKPHQIKQPLSKIAVNERAVWGCVCVE